MVIRVRCPQCDKSYRVEESRLGRALACPACGRKFTATASVAEGTSQDAPMAVPPTMANREMGGQQSTQPDSPPRMSQARPSEAASAERGPTPAPQAPAVHASEVPRKLGRFQVRRRLGAGAFGAVYHACDPVLDREIAIKVPHASTLQSETRRARVLTEAKAAAQLRHPNIVPVYEAGHDGDTYYIVSAFIQGQTLEDAIAGATFDFRRTARLVMDLAGAIHYAHQHGVIHRDIKPANIMLDAHGDPLIMDFGLARLEAAQSKLTHDGTVLGTPAYMPPEQAAGQMELVGPASDQYSLGVVLYELLCGCTPFSGPPSLVISLVINQEPDSPRKENPAIPKDLETICLKAIAKKPEHRYASCQELAEDLRRWLSGEPITARRVSPAERFVRWCRRNPVLASAISAAFLAISVGVLGVGWQWLRAERERARAVAHAETANEQRQEAERQRDATQRQAYGLSVVLAGNALSSDRTPELRQWLAAGRPQPCSPDFRHWEWWYLEGMAKRVQQVLPRRAEQVVFSPDGNSLALLLSYGKLLVWDRHGGQIKELARVKYKNNMAHTIGLAWNAKGDRLVTGGEPVVYDTATWQQLAKLSGHAADVLGVRWSPDGTMLATTSEDRTVKVWKTADWSEVCTYREHTGTVSGCDWSSDSQKIVSCQRAAGVTNVLKIWTVPAGVTERTIPLATGHVRWQPGGRFLAVAVGGSRGVWIVDARTGEGVAHLPSCGGSVMGLEWCRDGRKLVQRDASGQIVAWDADQFRHGQWQMKAMFLVGTLAVSADGNHAATPSSEGLVVTDVAGAPESRLLLISDRTETSVSRLDSRIQESVKAIAFSSDGKYLAAISDSGVLQGFEAASGREVSRITITGHVNPVALPGHVHAIAFRQGTSRLAILHDGVSVVDLLKRQELTKFALPRTLESDVATPSFAWQGTDNTLLVAASDGSLHRIHVARERVERVGAKPKSAVSTMAIAPGGGHLAYATQDGVTVTSAANPADQTTLQSSTSSVVALAWACDAKQLAIATADGHVQVWSVAERQCTTTLGGFGEDIVSLAWHPDGTRLAVLWNRHRAASAAENKRESRVTIWDPATGMLLLSLPCPTLASQVVWDPTGIRLAAAAAEGIVWMWDISSSEARRAAERSPLVPEKTAAASP